RRKFAYRPQLLPLEDRLPLGDAVLGTVVGASLLGAHAAPAASPREPSLGATTLPAVGEQARTAETAVAHAPTSHLADFSLAPACGWDMAASEAVRAWDPLALAAARPPHSFRWPSSAAQPTGPRLVLPAPEADRHVRSRPRPSHRPSWPRLGRPRACSWGC